MVRSPIWLLQQLFRDYFSCLNHSRQTRPVISRFFTLSQETWDLRANSIGAEGCKFLAQLIGAWLWLRVVPKIGKLLPTNIGIYMDI